MPELDSTHAPALRSWIPSANSASTDFPIQNLPYGRFRHPGDGDWHVGVAIGDQVLDLASAAERISWPSEVRAALSVLASGDMNAFMRMGNKAWLPTRRALSAALAEGSAHERALAGCLFPQAELRLGVPCEIGDYSDFYVGIHHAANVGRIFRPDNPLLPNYKWLPIGYHGRSSSIVASGSGVQRPYGQIKGPGEEPSLGPTQRLDYELELGFLIGPGNALGRRIDIAEAECHLFGVVLFNDWSARDVQSWEYQPLGPFTAKNFASTMSPWIVTMDALAPFRAPLCRSESEPPTLRYLDDAANRAVGALDVRLEVWLETAQMRDLGQRAHRLSTSRSAEAAYWTPAQLIAHHTVGGCNLNPGDLLGSGTLSGPGAQQAGSLLELSAGGTQPVILPSGERRSFLQDGDRVMLRGRCERDGARSIGFGLCEGTVLPALPT